MTSIHTFEVHHEPASRSRFERDMWTHGAEFIVAVLVPALCLLASVAFPVPWLEAHAVTNPHVYVRVLGFFGILSATYLAHRNGRAVVDAGMSAFQRHVQHVQDGATHAGGALVGAAMALPLLVRFSPVRVLSRSEQGSFQAIAFGYFMAHWMLTSVVHFLHPASWPHRVRLYVTMAVLFVGALLAMVLPALLDSSVLVLAACSLGLTLTLPAHGTRVSWAWAATMGKAILTLVSVCSALLLFHAWGA